MYDSTEAISQFELARRINKKSFRIKNSSGPLADLADLATWPAPTGDVAVLKQLSISPV